MFLTCNISALKIAILLGVVQIGGTNSEYINALTSVEAKIDIVRNAAANILESQLMEELVDKDQSLTHSGVVSKVNSVLTIDKNHIKNFDKYMKTQNASEHIRQPEKWIQRQSEKLLTFHNALSVKLGDLASSVSRFGLDQSFQILFNHIVEISDSVKSFMGILNTFKNNEELLQDLDELLFTFKLTKPYQKIISPGMMSLNNSTLFASLSKILEPNYCGGKITKTQAIIQFYDYITVQVAKGGYFLLKCYDIKELISGVNQNRMKQQVFVTLESNIKLLHESMMRNVDLIIEQNNTITLDDSTEEESETKECLVDLECTLSTATCKFNNVLLQDEITPIIYTTKHNTKTNNEITGVEFLTSSLDFIPNTVFKTFTGITTLSAEIVNLKVLKPYYFQNALKLKTLSIQNNKITKISAKTFVQAPNIVEISFHNNPIQFIDDQAFDGLLYLTGVHLEGCNIKAVSFEAFRNIAKLNFLHLGSNVCINKDFGGDKTAIKTELEINTRCSLNYLVMKNADDQKIRAKSLLTKVHKLEEMDQKMDQKIDNIISLIQKLTSKTPAPLENA